MKNEGWDIVQKLFCLSLCCVEGANKVIRICAMLQKSDEIMMEWWCGQVYMSFIQNCMYHVANSERDNLSHLKPYQGASEHI